MSFRALLPVIGVALLVGGLKCPARGTEGDQIRPKASNKVMVEDRVLKEGSEVTIEGGVLGREPRPEGLADADLALQVATADYGTVKVVYSAFRLCHNDVGADVKEGDRVEVYG